MDGNALRKIVGGKFFSVVFVKKDGTVRKMLCRLGVTKYLKGGTQRYDPAALNMITVYDMIKRQYRTINLNTLRSLQCGLTYTFGG